MALKTTVEGASYELLLKSRKQDLYLEAYRSNGVWIGVEGSSFTVQERLPFAGDYPKREDVAKYQSDQGLIGRQNTKVGKSQLSEAIQHLGSNENAMRAVKKGRTLAAIKARALLVLTHMLPESVRFRRISQFIGRNWIAGESLSPGLVGLENEWTTLSRGLTSSDFKSTEPLKKLGINTKEDILKEPGIAKAIFGGKKREVCSPEIGMTEKLPQSGLQNKPIGAESEPKVFGGKAGGVALAIGAVVVGCVLSETQMEKPKDLTKRKFSSWDEFWSGIVGGFEESAEALVSQENWDALKKSSGDLVRGAEEAVKAPSAQLPKYGAKKTERLSASPVVI
ncbi:hypothetical protein TWF694_006191 [Orbilia ellipsospora]|uniref:rRNA N-glycosylase n=1 Tax=Orbilia ellipsospora TaxID=2528407 RepID=A0AAV9WRI8_9PEZI